MGEIRITLETLYDILRNEKKRDDLQKLDQAFFKDVVDYVLEKEVLLKKQQESSDVFASAEKEKLEYELKSIKRILREIYEKREKKVIDIALNKSRTGSNIIDISAMLVEEKELYERILHLLTQFRQGVVSNISVGKMPGVIDFRPASTIEQKKAQLKKELEVETEKKFSSASINAGMTKIKFIHPVPSFIWKDMKEYGPFDVGDETEIFPEVADLIVRKGRAVKC